uniref:Uncharacterized protein n=1 Tax=Tanacetum cinerariifolium TaxID=118510 RepID=A0A6L2MD77_TANCI|nr:hypothetical protein [Tanacetum cinerariifolium]
MAVRTQPTLSPGLLSRLTEEMALSSLSFCKRYRPSCETPTPSSSPPLVSPALPSRKRYRGTSKLIADTYTESEDSEDKGTNSESEDVASEDRHPAVPIEGTIADEPLGIGYEAARHHVLELANDTTRFSITRMASGSLPISPTSLTVPSLIPSLVTTPVATISVDEDEFLEVGTQLELYWSILHDHTPRLDALPPTLIESFGRDITKLLDRSGAVKDENAATQCELQELRDRVTTLDQERIRRGE